jgi:hypothetical protein
MSGVNALCTFNAVAHGESGMTGTHGDAAIERDLQRCVDGLQQLISSDTRVTKQLSQWKHVRLQCRHLPDAALLATSAHGPARPRESSEPSAGVTAPVATPLAWKWLHGFDPTVAEPDMVLESLSCKRLAALLPEEQVERTALLGSRAFFASPPPHMVVCSDHPWQGTAKADVLLHELTHAYDVRARSVLECAHDSSQK